MEIHLTPDWTLGIELAVFLSALTITYFFVLKPTLRVLDARKAATLVARKEAEELNTKTAELSKQRLELIGRADLESKREGELVFAKALKEADEIVKRAKIEAGKILDAAEMSVDVSAKSVEEEVKKTSDELSKEIVAKVIGYTSPNPLLTKAGEL